jgi:IS6 family transposase
MGRNRGFKGRQFTAAVILWAVRWYLMFPISYRDLELMLLDRGWRLTTVPSFDGSRRMRPNSRSGSGLTYG